MVAMLAQFCPDFRGNLRFCSPMCPVCPIVVFLSLNP
jgi:hypothetical protein